MAQRIKKKAREYKLITANVPRPATKDPVRVTFADGDYMVPVWIVDSYGGPDKIRAIAPELSRFTFKAFVKSCELKLSQKTLKTATADYVKNALKSAFGGNRWQR